MFAIVLWGLGLQELIVWAIIVAGAIAVAVVLMKFFEVFPPPWLVRVFWIVIAVCVGIAAVRLIFSM